MSQDGFSLRKHKSSSSRDLTFLSVASIRLSDSYEAIARSYCDETLPKSMERTIVVKVKFESSLQTCFLIQYDLPASASYLWFYNDIPVTKCQIFQASTVFYFEDIFFILCHFSRSCLALP